jgi:hypothetical protein
MKIYEYKEGMSEEEQRNGAYWERNMLVLLLAEYLNKNLRNGLIINGISGWYYDTDNNWDGWKRVISIDNGKYCFHIPDKFDIGNLQEIKPNWDGHSTKDKYIEMFDILKIDTRQVSLYKSFKKNMLEHNCGYYGVCWEHACPCQCSKDDEINMKTYRSIKNEVNEVW